MKKLIYSLWGIIAAIIVASSCQKSDNTPIPYGKVVYGEERTPTSLIFNVKTKNADAASWVCLPSTQPAPTPAYIWQNGTALEVTKDWTDIPVEVNNLTPETAYTFYLAVRNVTLVSTSSASASTIFEYNIDAQDLTYAQGWYQGDFYKDGNGYYLIALSDKPLSGRGLPSTAPQKVIHLMLGATKSQNSNNAIIPDGKYQITDGTGIYTVDSYNSRYMEGFSVNSDGTVNGGQVKLMEGNIVVNYDGENYTIISDVVTSDESNYKYVKLTFNGPITFENEDPDSYIPIKGNIEVAMDGMGGYFYSSKEYLSDSYGQCNLTLWNTPIDASGFITGAGEVISLFFLPPYERAVDASWFVGTYRIREYYPYETWVVNDGIGGIWYDTEYAGFAAGGTYYNTYDDNGQATRTIGLAKSGTITITNPQGDDLKVDFNFTTEEGAVVRGSVTAPYTNVYDYNIYYPEAPRKEYVTSQESRNSAQSQIRRTHISELCNAIPMNFNKKR